MYFRFKFFQILFIVITIVASYATEIKSQDYQIEVHGKDNCLLLDNTAAVSVRLTTGSYELTTSGTAYYESGKAIRNLLYRYYDSNIIRSEVIPSGGSAILNVVDVGSGQPEIYAMFFDWSNLSDNTGSMLMDLGSTTLDVLGGSNSIPLNSSIAKTLSVPAGTYTVEFSGDAFYGANGTGPFQDIVIHYKSPNGDVTDVVKKGVPKEITVEEGSPNFGTVLLDWSDLGGNDGTGYVTLSSGGGEPELVNYGTTVIVHGLAPTGTNNEGLDDEQEWSLRMGEAIVDRLGAGRVYRIEHGEINQHGWEGGSSDIDDPNGEQVIVFSWIPESNEPIFGFAEGAADALTAFLFKGVELGYWNLEQLHFIAHSRGAVVSSEVIQRLGLIDNTEGASDIEIDSEIHFTTLDAHPWDRDDGDCIADPLWANDNDVNDGIEEVEDELGAGVVTWSNVSYNDNYYQGNCSEWDGLDRVLNGLPSYLGNTYSTPLSDILTHRSFGSGSNNEVDLVLHGSNEHSAVHSWYYGTIDLSCNQNSEEFKKINPLVSLVIPVPHIRFYCNDGDKVWFDPTMWYNSSTRSSVGFNMSMNFQQYGSSSLLTPDNPIPIQDDNNYDIDKIFNGDFSMIPWSNYIVHPLISPLQSPGWGFQGGESFPLHFSFLTLSILNLSATHNSLFIPSTVQAINFDMRVVVRDACELFEDCYEGNSNQLELLIGNEIIASIPTREASCDMMPQRIHIPDEFKGKTNTLTFQLTDPDEDGAIAYIQAIVTVDNIEFDLDDSPEVYVSTCSPVDVIITDEEGNQISRDGSQISNTYYELYPKDDGDTVAIIKLRNPEPNMFYHIDVLPWLNTDPSELYSLNVYYGDKKYILADQQPISSIPLSGYFFSTLDTGSIAGSVSANSIRLFGVPVGLYDNFGVMIGSAVTNDTGYYQFSALDNGDYTVSISTPLDYQAVEENKAVTVRGLPHEVNFELTQLEIPLAQRGRGYWMHQVNSLVSGKGNPQESYDDMCTFMELIRTHFNDHALNSVNVFNVPLTENCDQRLEALRTTISPKPKATMNEKARAHLTALLLNMVSGKIAQWHVISDDGATVSQAITWCNLLISDTNLENDERAKEIAEMVNEGETVPASWINLATPIITYKTVTSETLPTEYTLNQNYPNPFNPNTEISFSLPEALMATLEVFNINGQQVATLIDGHFEAGHHQVVWDSRDTRGNQIASGIYLYRLTAGEFVETKKMVLLK